MSNFTRPPPPPPSKRQNQEQNSSTGRNVIGNGHSSSSVPSTSSAALFAAGPPTGTTVSRITHPPAPGGSNQARYSGGMAFSPPTAPPFSTPSSAYQQQANQRQFPPPPGPSFPPPPMQAPYAQPVSRHVIQGGLPPPPPPRSAPTPSSTALHDYSGLPPPQPHLRAPPPPPNMPNDPRLVYDSQGLMQTTRLAPTSPTIPLPRLRSPDNPTTPYYPKASILEGQQLVQPPPANLFNFPVFDDGNASPHLIRSSMYAVPRNRGIWAKAGNLPFGICCTPAVIATEDDENSSSTGSDEAAFVPCIREQEPPPRCRTCAAYPNPFFLNGTCNLCGTYNRSMAGYGGPALQYGTVDFQVEGPYITRDIPVQPVSIYALDMTCPKIREYFPILVQIGQDMAESFWNRSYGSSVIPRIGLCLVSATGIAVYGHRERRYNIVCDTSSDPFCPLPLVDWTYDLSTPEGLDSWKAFLEEELAPTFGTLKMDMRGKSAKGQDSSELSCGGAALKFLSDALSHTGGRGTLITWRRPNYGVGALSYREKQPSAGEPADAYKSYTPIQFQTDFQDPVDKNAATFYTNLAKVCVKDRVTLDVIFHTQNVREQPFLDLATLGEVCRKTSGNLVWMTNMDWETTLYENLRRPLLEHTFWDSVFKVRCSEGLHIHSFSSMIGEAMEGSIGTSPELEISSLSPSTCISVNLDFRVGGIAKEAKFAFIQSALLFSSLSGKRYVRVSTLALRVTTSQSEVFSGVDVHASIALQMISATKQATKVVAGDQKGWRDSVRTELYHKSIASMSCSPQVGSLPERLELIPLAINCALKSPMLRHAFPRRLNDCTKLVPSADERSYFQFHLSRASPQNILMMLHPTISYIVDDQVLESCLIPTISELKDDGVYLVDSGLRSYLLVGKNAGSAIQQLVRSYDQLNASTLGRLISDIKSGGSIFRPSFSPVTPVIHDGSMLDADVMDLMVYDAVAGESTYLDLFQKFMTSVRQRVQNQK